MHKHTFRADGYCPCGEPSKAQKVRIVLAEEQARLRNFDAEFEEIVCPVCGRQLWEKEREAHERTHLSRDPYTSITGRYVCRAVRAEDGSPFEMLATNAFEAMGAALALARLSEGNLMVVQWENAAGEKRELTTKVMVNKVL
jgi:hypothetical protein